MWLWLGSAILVGAGLLFDKVGMPDWAKGPNHPDNKVVPRKKGGFPWGTVLSMIGSTLSIFLWYFFLRRKPAVTDDRLDYYKGALGLSDAEVVGKSKAYLAGLLKRKKEEKFALSKDIATDLPVQNVTITRGRGYGGRG